MEEKWRGDTCFPHSPSSWHLFYKSPGTTNRISRLPYSDFPGSVNNWLIIALHALKGGKGCWDATGGEGGGGGRILLWIIFAFAVMNRVICDLIGLEIQLPSFSIIKQTSDIMRTVEEELLCCCKAAVVSCFPSSRVLF